MAFYTRLQPQQATSSGTDLTVDDLIRQLFSQTPEYAPSQPSFYTYNPHSQAEPGTPKAQQAEQATKPSRCSPAPKTHAAPVCPARPATRRSLKPSSFTPKFDLFETANAFVLEGELPGLANKKALQIEFVDHQSLVIKGQIERIGVLGSKAAEDTTVPPTPAVEEKNPEAEGEEEEEVVVPRPGTPPRPTVEDVPDEDDDGFSTIAMTPSTSSQGITVEKKAAEAVKVVEKLAEEQTKYWVSERTVGSFQRTFRFPGQVEQEEVSARLENGVLRVVVPKRKVGIRRRIEVL